MLKVVKDFLTKLKFSSEEVLWIWLRCTLNVTEFEFPLNSLHLNDSYTHDHIWIPNCYESFAIYEVFEFQLSRKIENLGFFSRTAWMWVKLLRCVGRSVGMTKILLGKVARLCNLKLKLMFPVLKLLYRMVPHINAENGLIKIVRI